MNKTVPFIFPDIWRGFEVLNCHSSLSLYNPGCNMVFIITFVKGYLEKHRYIAYCAEITVHHFIA